MGDPKRLVQEGVSRIGVAALQSARSDSPPPDTRRRVLASVGVVAVAVGASQTAGAVAAKTAGTAQILSAAKWFVMGALAGGMVIAGSTWLPALMTSPSPTAHRPVLGPPSPSQSVVVAASSEPPAIQPKASASPPEEVLAPAPSVVAKDLDAPDLESIADGGTEAATSTNRRLQEEVVALDRARAAMGSGDGMGALRSLDTYEAGFPNGILHPEATALRIEALLRVGNRAAATALGQQFLASHPRSPVADRVRSLLSPPNRDHDAASIP